jgi:hypothetical protein
MRSLLSLWWLRHRPRPEPIRHPRDVKIVVQLGPQTPDGRPPEARITLPVLDALLDSGDATRWQDSKQQAK